MPTLSLSQQAKQRIALREAFLQSCNWADSERQPLNQDASFRQYTRLCQTDSSTLLMDAPPPERPVGDFAQLATHLLQLGVRAPKVTGRDDKNGFLLLEDLGDTTVTRALAEGADETTLYTMAIDVLSHLHQQPYATSIEVQPYDVATLQQEAALLIQWFYSAQTGHEISNKLEHKYATAWQQVFEALPALPDTLVLRDYHVDNLMVLNGGTHCAVLDFQDALIGSPAYDVVSLLQDARRDITPSLQQQMLTHYFAAWPDNKQADQQAFMHHYHVLGAQRHCKVLGIFVRLHKRDNKPIYLPHLPRVAKLLQTCLTQPQLAPVANWFEQHLDLNQLSFSMK